MEYDKILKLVEECALRLSPDPLAGIKSLEADFKDDPNTLAGILGLIAMNHKEHSEVIFNYLKVGYFVSRQGREKKYDAQVAHFPQVRRSIFTQLDLLDNHFEVSNYADAEKTILEIIGQFEKLLHDVSLGKQLDKTERSDAIHTEIELFRKRLNRLSDYLVIKNEDKILKEMAAIQKAMGGLEKSIEQFLSDNF